MLSSYGFVPETTVPCQQIEATIPSYQLRGNSECGCPTCHRVLFRLRGHLTSTEWETMPRPVNALKTSRRWVWSLIREEGGGCRGEGFQEEKKGIRFAGIPHVVMESDDYKNLHASAEGAFTGHGVSTKRPQ